MSERELSFAIVTTPLENAESLAKALVEKRLAACVQVTAPVTSYFWWEDEVQTEEEVVLFLKTDRQLKQEIEEVLAQLHPYEVPELLFLPVRDGLERYLSWMGDELR
jgi:periplasmic divalent cation tolerance protein